MRELGPMAAYQPIKLIEEVKKRPGLYLTNNADREERLKLWKEVGASIYSDWAQCNKATAYDRVLQIQRKWRSLRDAYNRELRARRSGVRVNKRVYVYFKKMSFLGGFDGELSDDNEADETPDLDTHDADAEDIPDSDQDTTDPLQSSSHVKVQKKTKRRAKKVIHSYSPSPEQIEMSYTPDMSESETDSDKLFLLSFLPEMKQLPLHIKMWARAQIANTMQEAVACHYSNTMPSDKSDVCTSGLKKRRHDSSESIS